MPLSTHELDAPPWARVDLTLMATARAIRQAYERRLASDDLKLSQAFLLAVLREAGALTQTQLALAVGLGRAATGSVIAGLERRGLVERQPDPSDRRAWRVALTREGAALAERVHEVDQELRSELRAGISRPERQQLASLLLRLQANLERVLEAERRA